MGGDESEGWVGMRAKDGWGRERRMGEDVKAGGKLFGEGGGVDGRRGSEEERETLSFGELAAVRAPRACNIREATAVQPVSDSRLIFSGTLSFGELTASVSVCCERV